MFSVCVCLVSVNKQSSLSRPLYTLTAPTLAVVVEFKIMIVFVVEIVVVVITEMVVMVVVDIVFTVVGLLSTWW